MLETFKTIQTVDVYLRTTAGRRPGSVGYTQTEAEHRMPFAALRRILPAQPPQKILTLSGYGDHRGGVTF